MFNERIKPLREKRRTPQRQFVASLEIDTATCKIEKGERHAKAEQVVVIADLKSKNI